MRTLFKNLEIFNDYSSYSSLVNAGYTVEQIIKDLFYILFDNLWTMETSLREYVIFQNKLTSKKEILAFKKPDKFVKSSLENSGINIPFRGGLKKNASGKEVVNYVNEIIEIYIKNEETLLSGIKQKILEIHDNCITDHGIFLSIEDVPLMQGVYHSNTCEINTTQDSSKLNLHCNSKLTLFL